MADIPNKPITRKEAYLAAIGGQDVDVPAKPITREEAYLAAILNNGLGAKNLEDLDDVLIVDPVNGYVVKFDAELGKWVAGPASGSGGTSDYTDLSNKPQINGNTLAGDKSAEDLGLAGADDIPTKVSDLDNDANFISDDNYVHTDNNYDDTAKGIVEGVTEALAGKQDTLTFDNIPTENSNNPVKSGGVYASDEAIRQWTTAEAKSASGNPITLLDGSARKAEGLSVTCNPKQNLHGYDHPWAGGAGKNKLDVSDCIGTQDGKTFALSDNLGITVSGSASGTVFRPANTNVVLTPSTNYVVNGMSADIKLRFQIYDSNNTMTRELYATNVDLSFTTTADEVKAVVYIVVANNANGTVYPMLRLASESDATFEPYSNICPISGYDECVVDDHGKNFFDKDNTESGYIDGSGNIVPSATWSHEFIKVNGNTQYTISGCFVNDTPKHCWFDKDMHFISAFSSHTNGTFTSPQNASYMGICAIVMTNPSHDLDTIQVEEGNTATPFVPYSHANVTLTFGETIYGGSVDFKTGKVTVTKAYKVFDGTENWYVQVNANRVYTDNLVNSIAKPSASGTVADITSNIFGAISSTASYTGTRGVSVGTSGYVEFADGIGGMTVDAWKTYLENNTVAVCYELATPTELTLTPAELELLKGYNYITTNGTTIVLDYLPDSLLAEAEKYADDADSVLNAKIDEIDGRVDSIEAMSYHTDGNGAKTVTLTNVYQQVFVSISILDTRTIYLVVQQKANGTVVETIFSTAGKTPIDIAVTHATDDSFTITLPRYAQTNIISTEPFSVE